MNTSLPAGEWLAIGSLNHHTQLFIGDTVVVTFYDAESELSDLSFEFKISHAEQGEPQNWPRLIADYINVHIPLVEAGRMTEAGLVVAYRANQIYALAGCGISAAKVTFQCIAKDNDRNTHAEPEYDYIYPQQSSVYNAGVKVLQPKTGHIYRCKPWPFSAFCKVTQADNPLYEPGVGQSWDIAWQQVSH